MSVLTGVARRVLRMLGWQVWRARGGIFLAPLPRVRRTLEPPFAARPVRLNLGCGDRHLHGYVNIDVVHTHATDLVCDMTSLPMFGDGSIHAIRLDASLEHLYRFERQQALREWHRVLARGGRLEILWLPDFDAYVGCYTRGASVAGFAGLELMYRGTHGNPEPFDAPEQLHKDLFTKASIRYELEHAGFEIERIASEPFGREAAVLGMNVLAKKR